MARITEEQQEQLIKILTNRIDEMNALYLQNIGEALKKIKELTPSEAHKLVQILKYGGSYEDIVNEMAKYSNLNIKDIDRIFSLYAKKDQEFYEQFYKYRKIPYIPYEENITLQRHTRALANIVKNEMYNFTRSNVLGYAMEGLDGRKKFFGLRETYNRVLDEALINVGQGKETFDSAMTKTLKELGGSGLRTIEYKDTGRSVRLDSAVSMHLKDRISELHNEQQMIFGEEFGADGVEISVHAFPAPDHEEAQGRQFTKKEYEKLQLGDVATDYKGRRITLDHDGKNGYRPISAMNCYHNPMPIILGVSKPLYSDKQLDQIIKENNEGFNYNGKHYTKYEGTQLQRRLERAIRQQKDIQILAKAEDNDNLILLSQKNITKLNQEYKKMSEIAGLQTSPRRTRVPGYKRKKVK